MKEVLLHIGMHKTGSSSIQASLKNYTDDTTSYASFHESNHSMPLTTIFSSKRYEYHVWKKKGLSKEEIDKKRKRYLEILEKYIGSPKYHRLLISGEDISLLPNDDKRSLIEFFQSRGCDVKIVCFVRAPHDFVKSSMQQRIKGGQKGISYIDPYYGQRLRAFSDLLPKENLIVRDFADVIGEYGDVVLGFASICGLEKGRIETKRVNESLSVTTTRLLYRLNKLPVATFGTQNRVVARQKLIKILSREFPASSDNKLDGNILSGLLKPDLDDEMGFLLEEFKIDYGKVTHSPNLEACEAYLSDLSGLKRQRLAKVLKKHQVQTSPRDSIDEMLIELYHKIYLEPTSSSSNDSYLRNIAKKLRIKYA